jgi:hypothetical protein
MGLSVLRLLLNGTTLIGLLFYPFITSWHIAIIHKPWLGDKIAAIRLILLFALGLLGALYRSPRLRNPGFCVKGNSVRFVPPQWDAITIPIL